MHHCSRAVRSESKSDEVTRDFFLFSSSPFPLKNADPLSSPLLPPGGKLRVVIRFRERQKKPRRRMRTEGPAFRACFCVCRTELNSVSLPANEQFPTRTHYLFQAFEYFRISFCSAKKHTFARGNISRHDSSHTKRHRQFPGAKDIIQAQKRGGRKVLLEPAYVRVVLAWNRKEELGRN